MDRPPNALERNLALLTKETQARRRSRTLVLDPTFQRLVADLVSARKAVGMTQEDVAMRMRTTKSAISRLESAASKRPMLSTIANYARAVGARVEVRIRRSRTP